MIRSSRSRGRLAIAAVLSIGLLWATAGAALGAGGTAPGGTIYFYRASVPSGPYAVAPDGTGLRQLPCDGDRTRAGSPRRVLRIEPVGGTFARLALTGTVKDPKVVVVEEPIVRLVSSDEACGDVRSLWEPGAGYVLRLPVWSIGGSRVALDVARYDSSGQMLDQAVWVGDIDTVGGLSAVHLAIALPMVESNSQPVAGFTFYDVDTPALSWSPDSRRVTYSGYREPTPAGAASVMYVGDVGPAGSVAPVTERRVLVTGSKGQMQPAFSPVPGDDRIAYVETTSTRGCIHNDVFIVPSTGGTPRQVTTTKTANFCQLGAPDWSPDGRWLTFHAASSSLSGIGIWVMPADGSAKAVAVALTPGGVAYYGPRWRR